MKAAKIFYSSLHIVVLLFLFFIGCVFLGLYFNNNFFTYFIDAIINRPKIILKTGTFSLILMITLFICFYFMHKSQYIRFVLNNQKRQIDKKLIHSYIEKYFQTIYPNKKNKIQIDVIGKEKIEIIALVDSFENKIDFLLNLERQIGKILSEHLGYQNEFIVTLKKD